MQKVVIDGANGYVASHLIRELLKQNYEVVALVRDNGVLSSQERMHNVLKEAGAESGDLENLKVFNYSLLHNDFDLKKKELEQIFDREADFFHFAASLKFTQKNRKEIFDTNVNGTENAINVFQSYSKPGSRFFFVGTVYSCGRHDEVFRERFYPNAPIVNFRNYYEQSKRYAENVVQKYIREKNLKGHIIRLSQVVGNNKTG